MRLGINGFGRIGRLTYRALRKSGRDIDLVAVNDLTDGPTLAHLLKYDSVHGRLDADVKVEEGALIVEGDELRVLSERDPTKLPWGDLGVDVVIESTGRFKDRDQAAQHLAAGAKKVIVSAPAKGADLTVVMGVNDDKLEAGHDVVSNASCTTNCLAPVAKVVLATAGWVHGLMTTTHAYTASQHVVDSPDKDLRRARAAALSLIPTTTGAARATALVLPELAGKIDGVSIRVPTPNVSLVDLKFVAGRNTTPQEVNEALIAAADGVLNGVLTYTHHPLVSSDLNHDPHSSTILLDQTKVIDGNFVNILGWYDNEWGFSNRMVDVTKAFAATL